MLTSRSKSINQTIFASNK
uniref:Uncharacterized protein n=1 Tax=Rhizophora mucronata TaxID=61149 RepID=A0A2P2NF20_RHIMU